MEKDTREIVWRYENDRPTPVLTNGLLYCTSRDHTVYALDAQTGEVEWKFETGWINGTAPTVADGVVFVGTRRPANFFAIDATSGEQLWQFEPYAPAKGDPIVVDGVFFGTADWYLTHSTQASKDPARIAAPSAGPAGTITV